MDIHAFKAKYGITTPGLLIGRYIEAAPSFQQEASLAKAIGEMVADLESALVGVEVPSPKPCDCCVHTPTLNGLGLFNRSFEPGKPVGCKIVRSWRVSDNTATSYVGGYKKRPVVINFTDGTSISATEITWQETDCGAAGCGYETTKQSANAP